MKHLNYLVLILVASACHSTPLPEPPTTVSTQEILQYKTWHRVTDEPRLLSYSLAAACYQPAGAELDDYEFIAEDAPHAERRVHVYLNDVAFERAEDAAYPVGSVIVQDMLADGFWTVPALSVMIKGLDNKWEYMHHDADSTVRGRDPLLESCADCHSEAPGGGEVFGGWLSAPISGS